MQISSGISPDILLCIVSEILSEFAPRIPCDFYLRFFRELIQKSLPKCFLDIPAQNPFLVFRVIFLGILTDIYSFVLPDILHGIRSENHEGTI